MARKTIREELAVIQTELKNLIKVMTEHDKVSDMYRRKTMSNEASISWLTWGLRGIYGSVIVGTLAIVIRTLLTK